MKVGQIFDLPTSITYKLGYTGKLTDTSKTVLLGRYEVIEVDEILKGKVITVYTLKHIERQKRLKIQKLNKGIYK